MTDDFDKKDIELVVEMPEEMVIYLNQLVEQVKAQGGEINRDAIINATMNVFLGDDHFDLSNISNERELVERILESSPRKQLY